MSSQTCLPASGGIRDPVWIPAGVYPDEHRGENDKVSIMTQAWRNETTHELAHRGFNSAVKPGVGLMYGAGQRNLQSPYINTHACL